ncbi:multidrug DMT transporter permease [Pseudorhodoferax aquiterrae]|uniref:Multidrug DMT transporter permease n=1 Tax=Pseudorhodoferax aquiterrae TaxID=747304 RepID=A0ABQ3FVW3_9BURK|nr:DMT family transporter [Pseudorhodoferax aquiterrae]GHC71665.1 multidrug DMT transporter permease [Pseudorhodoferax aquiterrae]
MPSSRSSTAAQGTWAGILCGMAAGALWGLVFLAPELAHGFTPLQLTAGRFLAYGLFACALLLPRWRRLAAQLGRADWALLARLALLGNTLYYVLLASAVQQGGIAMTSLVIGFLPVAVTVIGSRAAGAVPLRRLAPSLLCGLAGILSIGWQSLAGAAGASPLALLCAIGALACWTAYAVGNARALAQRPQVSVQDWNLATGVVTGAQALLLLPFALLLDTRVHTGADWARLAGVVLGVALAASIVGNALWNRMSRLLPLTLVGQMILFETLFALLYGFLWEWRTPRAAEWLAMACVAASVLSCVHAHRRPAPSGYAAAA